MKPTITTNVNVKQATAQPGNWERGVRANINHHFANNQCTVINQQRRDSTLIRYA